MQDLVSTRLNSSEQRHINIAGLANAHIVRG